MSKENGANVAKLHGGEGLPLSAIAARTAAERADRHPFTPKHKEQVAAVLARLQRAADAA